MNFPLSDFFFVTYFLDYSFARVALAATLIIALTCGFLSPVVVLKERAYIGDILAHLIFPGVIAGYFASQTYGFPLWVCLLVGAAVSGFVGHVVTDFLRDTLKLPPDAAAVVAITGFFGAGVVTVSRLRGTRIDLERILFGDVLTLTEIDVGILLAVLFCVVAALLVFRRHWDAWVCDEQFATIAGFRVGLVKRLFTVLVTFSVLSGLFAVGGLMISALLTIPAVLFPPRSVVSWRGIIASVVLGGSGLLVAFRFDWPVGSTIVVLGFLLVLFKALYVRVRS